MGGSFSIQTFVYADKNSKWTVSGVNLRRKDLLLVIIYHVSSFFIKFYVRLNLAVK